MAVQRVRSPCTRECIDRSMGCHSKCVKYEEYNAAVAASRQEEAQRKANEWAYNDYIHRQRKLKRRKRPTDR